MEHESSRSCSEICKVLSNRGLLSTSKRGDNNAYIVVGVTWTTLTTNWKGGFSGLVLGICQLFRAAVGSIASPSGITLFHLYMYEHTQLYAFYRIWVTIRYCDALRLYHDPQCYFPSTLHLLSTDHHLPSLIKDDFHFLFLSPVSFISFFSSPTWSLFTFLVSVATPGHIFNPEDRRQERALSISLSESEFHYLGFLIHTYFQSLLINFIFDFFFLKPALCGHLVWHRHIEIPIFMDTFTHRDIIVKTQVKKTLLPDADCSQGEKREQELHEGGECEYW